MRGVRAWIADDPKRRLAIVATHRRTTANFADRIYQIADGRHLAADQSAFDAVPTAEAGNV
jgi:ABC-type lipoprotein export system ATPase subunit